MSEFSRTELCLSGRRRLGASDVYSKADFALAYEAWCMQRQIQNRDIKRNGARLDVVFTRLRSMPGSGAIADVTL